MKGRQSAKSLEDREVARIKRDLERAKAKLARVEAQFEKISKGNIAKSKKASR